MAKQIISDEESVIKRKARSRLIGAIALTILIVILLPMLLDSQPPTPTQDIEVKIPDKDKVGEFVPKMVLPPLDASVAASQPVIAPLLDGSRVSAPVVAVNPVVALTPTIEPAPKPVKADIKAKVEVKPKLPIKPVAHVHEGFVIQVGAFSSADAAKKLQKELHQQGYPSYTEKVGDKVRVRIGDYASHAEAEKAQHKLEKQGHHPIVHKLN